MLIKICELILNIILNLLLVLNKDKKQKNKYETNKMSLTSIAGVVDEIKKIELERKGLYEKNSVKTESINVNLQELNDRLKNIEVLLYEKKAGLLKSKLLSGDYKEKDDGD